MSHIKVDSLNYIGIMDVYFYLNRTLRIVRASDCLVKMVIIYALQVLLGYSKPWHHGVGNYF